jgi:hypothetical protein
MIDDEEGQSVLLSQLQKEIQELDGLAGIHTCGRFVEQKKFRSWRQGTGDLEASLLAVRKGAGPFIGDVAKADLREKMFGPAVHLLFFLSVAGRAAPGFKKSRLQTSMMGSQAVFEAGQLGAKSEILEGSGYPAVHSVCLHTVDSLPLQIDDAQLGL